MSRISFVAVTAALLLASNAATIAQQKTMTTSMAEGPSTAPSLKLWQRPDKNTARKMIAKGEVVAISAKSDQAYVIGKLPAGSVICLQYVEGKWKGWGNIPTDCPDDPAAEGSKRSRLAIAEILHSGKQHVEAVVPPNTRADPYFFVTGHDMEKAVLRMNDNDGVFGNNPDRGVKYRIFVQRP